MFIGLVSCFVPALLPLLVRERDTAKKETTVAGIGLASAAK
jgi:hypothetical protein